MKMQEQCYNLEMLDADVTYYPHFIAEEQSKMLSDKLMNKVMWRQEKVKLFNKEVLQPRLTAWYGDVAYRYSGITMQPLPWPDFLVGIKAAIEDAVNSQFNSVLLNLYRNGKDSVSWHADDEPELRAFPTIASLSLGAVRTIQFKHKSNKALQKVQLDLLDGSLLIMQAETQHHWLHQIPKTTRPVGPRINLTFRIIS